MANPSAAPAIQTAVVDALLADAGVTAIIGPSGVYAGVVPAGVPLPYITLGTVTELPDRAFQRGGHLTNLTLDLWATRYSDALALYRAVTLALDGVTLALDGHLMVMGSLSLLATIQDPTGPFHSAVIYAVTTEVAS